eukprot:scaffold126661_cov28-Tisochrysis_lutea.AAC.3
MINLAHDWLHIYLPHALKKIDRVSFGIMSDDDLKQARRSNPLMPRSRAKLAIPFISKDVPSNASEFAQPDVVIGLTLLAYRYEGMRYEDFVEALDKVMKDFALEGGEPDERPSALRHRKWVEGMGGVISGKGVDERHVDASKRHLPLELLDPSDDRLIRPLYELLRFSPSFIHWCAR